MSLCLHHVSPMWSLNANQEGNSKNWPHVAWLVIHPNVCSLHHTVYGCKYHMHDSVTYFILRHVLGYNSDQPLHHWHHRLRLGMTMFNRFMGCMHVLHSGLQVWLKSVHEWNLPLACSRIYFPCIMWYKHILLVISTLNYLFPLHTKTKNYYLKYHNVLCYGTLHNVYKFHFKNSY